MTHQSILHLGHAWPALALQTNTLLSWDPEGAFPSSSVFHYRSHRAALTQPGGPAGFSHQQQQTEGSC